MASPFRVEPARAEGEIDTTVARLRVLRDLLELRKLASMPPCRSRDLPPEADPPEPRWLNALARNQPSPASSILLFLACVLVVGATVGGVCAVVFAVL